MTQILRRKRESSQDPLRAENQKTVRLLQKVSLHHLERSALQGGEGGDDLGPSGRSSPPEARGRRKAGRVWLPRASESSSVTLQCLSSFKGRTVWAL